MPDVAWKCNRCTADGSSPGGTWPKKWTLHRVGFDNIGEVIICPDCSEELASWWRLPKQVLALHNDGEAS